MSESPGVIGSVALSSEMVEAIAQRAAAIVLDALAAAKPAPASPYMTIPEAAEYLRCSSRQRVDDLLSSGRLTRFKDGARTLVSRAEVEAMLARDVAHPLPKTSRGRIGRGAAA